MAGNNPGARFVVMYRPIEEIAEPWETKDADDHLNSNNGLGQAVKTWNRSLQGTRRFIRKSLVPRVLLISYHDFLFRTETVVPLISRFLELELDESEMADLADEALQSERVRSTETLGREKRSLTQSTPTASLNRGFWTASKSNGKDRACTPRKPRSPRLLLPWTRWKPVPGDFSRRSRSWSVM